MKAFSIIGFFLVAMISIQLAFGDQLTTFNNIFLVLAVGLGAYMAINIGANDVANSVGPAVGSKAISLKGAIIIAVIGEVSGALIAGGEVVKTVKKGIIDIGGFTDPNMFIFVMLSALLAAALWLNLATYLKAPVSTTHSIVGGVMGGGIAALGFSVVQWGTMGKIAASWIISPVLGGIVAALFLYSIKHLIIFKDDKVTQAKKWVPVFVGIMSWAFSSYIIIKGLKNLIKIEATYAYIIGFGIAVGVYLIVKHILKKSGKIENNRTSINKLFTIPLIFSAGLLTFAHGANDVANAIGPLAAIYDAVMTNSISTKVGIPFWILLLGGSGIAVGLAIFGPRIIKTVGGEITELDQVRAFSIALSAAITVIIASQLGMPVSSTHIALGGVFGVGFLREWLDRKRGLKEKYIERGIIRKIVTAWIVTVPIAAFLSGMFFVLFQLLFNSF